MYERFTDRARKVMRFANQEARRFRHASIDTEHILLGLIKEGSGVAANALKNLGVDHRKAQAAVEQLLQAGPEGDVAAKLPQSPQTRKVIEYAIAEARALHHNYVGTEHLLLGLLREQEGLAAQVLRQLGVHHQDAREETLRILGHELEEKPSRRSAPRTLALDAFTRDLPALPAASRPTLSPARAAAVDRVLHVLSLAFRNNPVLIGEAYTEQWAVVLGVAGRLAAGDVPARLQGHRLLVLELARLMAGCKDCGQFEKRLGACLHDARRAPNVILVVQDARSLVGADGAIDASYVLKPAVIRGDFPCVIVATAAEYQLLQLDRPLEGRLRPVRLEPPDAAETRAILQTLRKRLEDFHRALIPDAALELAISLAGQHFPGRHLPDAARDLLDEAGALVRSPLPDESQELKDLKAELDRVNEAKEDAVAAQDFDRGAKMRDEADRLKRQMEQLTTAWRIRAAERGAVVGEAALVEAVRALGG